MEGSGYRLHIQTTPTLTGSKQPFNYGSSWPWTLEHGEACLSSTISTPCWGRDREHLGVLKHVSLLSQTSLGGSHITFPAWQTWGLWTSCGSGYSGTLVEEAVNLLELGPETGTASLLPHSIGQSTHRAYPEWRRGDKPLLFREVCQRIWPSWIHTRVVKKCSLGKSCFDFRTLAVLFFFSS